MLRITEICSNEAATLRLAGRVIGPWVAELRRASEEALARGRFLTVDLGDVSFVDQGGVALLHELRYRQVTLTNCSPFLAERLKELNDDPSFCGTGF